jgi:hypothetical protein
MAFEHPLRSGLGNVDPDPDSRIGPHNRDWDLATDMLLDQAAVYREVIGPRKAEREDRDDHG